MWYFSVHDRGSLQVHMAGTALSRSLRYRCFANTCQHRSLLIVTRCCIWGALIASSKLLCPVLLKKDSLPLKTAIPQHKDGVIQPQHLYPAWAKFIFLHFLLYYFLGKNKQAGPSFPALPDDPLQAAFSPCRRQSKRPPPQQPTSADIRHVATHAQVIKAMQGSKGNLCCLLAFYLCSSICMEKMDCIENPHLERHLGIDATKEEKAELRDTCSSCPVIGQRLSLKASLFLKRILLPWTMLFWPGLNQQKYYSCTEEVITESGKFFSSCFHLVDPQGI